MAQRELTTVVLCQIVFENRKRSGSLNDCLLSIDGTDCRIPQQGAAVQGNPFSSHKFKGKCGLRYELGVDIKEGNLVWINGPFPCGKYPDITIFRNGLRHFLDPFERVEADDGYIGEAPYHVKCPKCAANPEENRRMQGLVRARHETLNGRFKAWEILKQLTMTMTTTMTGACARIIATRLTRGKKEAAAAAAAPLERRRELRGRRRRRRRWRSSTG